MSDQVSGDTGRTERWPRCPTCGDRLHAVRNDSAFNNEQWDSVKAGDYYCERPACSKRKASGTSFSYFFKSELALAPEPNSSTDECANCGHFRALHMPACVDGEGVVPCHCRAFVAAERAPEPSGVPPEEGGPVARFAGLMDALEQRFPDPTPLAGEPPELRYLAAIDRIRERATTEVERVARAIRQGIADTDGLEGGAVLTNDDVELIVARVVARLSATPKEEARDSGNPGDDLPIVRNL